jgi:hypothetical protein
MEEVRNNLHKTHWALLQTSFSCGDSDRLYPGTHKDIKIISQRLLIHNEEKGGKTWIIRNF